MTRSSARSAPSPCPSSRSAPSPCRLALLAAARPSPTKGCGCSTTSLQDRCRKYGFAPTRPGSTRPACAVRLAGGCSGSFVSPNGLVMTNYHCVVGCVQDVTTARPGLLEGLHGEDDGRRVQCPTSRSTSYRDHRRHAEGPRRDARQERGRLRRRPARGDRDDQQGLRDRPRGALRRREPLPRRAVRPVQVPPLPGRAAGLRARVRHGLLGGDPDNFNFRAGTSTPRSCGSTRTASRWSRRTTSASRRPGRRKGSWSSWPPPGQHLPPQHGLRAGVRARRRLPADDDADVGAARNAARVREARAEHKRYGESTRFFVENTIKSSKASGTRCSTRPSWRARRPTRPPSARQ